MSTRVLVIVSHADDEAIGAGGTIARHAASGDEVHLAFLTDGVGARGQDAAEKASRWKAARAAAAVLGTREPRFFDFPDNRLDSVDRLELAQAVEGLVAEVLPEIVYTHHVGDLNVDHVACHYAVLTACRPQPGFCVRRIYGLEVASSTDWSSPGVDTFCPTRFVDISATLDAKRRALECYHREMRPFPHQRSYEALEALARWRGATVGLAAAEGFTVLREIETSQTEGQA